MTVVVNTENLKEFISDSYRGLTPELIEKQRNEAMILSYSTIDFERIIVYLKNYAGKHYITPEKTGSEKEKMETFVICFHH